MSESQRYKVGRYILERRYIRFHRRWRSRHALYGSGDDGDDDVCAMTVEA